MMRFISAIKVPLVLLIFLSITSILSQVNLLPSTQTISYAIGEALNKYGLIIIGPLAFFENLTIFNVYFPGSIVILTTMALSAGNFPRATSIALIYFIFSIPAYHVDYFLGTSLRGRQTKTTIPSILKPVVHSKLWLRFMIFFSHPQLAALLCFQLGSEDHKYSEITKYMLLFAFGWTLFWSFVMYSIGTYTEARVDLSFLAYVYLFGLLIYDIYRYYAQTRKNSIS